MIFDLNEGADISSSGSYDVCIAGAGVAGIVVALVLAEAGRRVLMLEAGGLFPTNESQDLYAGDIIGHEYFDLDTARLRFLGGTSGHWAGWCRPLDPHDFERREFIPESGWPIDVADLEPHLAQARSILELDEFARTVALPGSDGSLNEAFFSFSGRGNPVRFAEKYEDTLRESPSIDVVLNANVVDAIRDGETGRLTHLVFLGYADDAQPTDAAADFFVFAMGGIENARAFLNAGLGDEQNLIGRYFMEHPVFNAAYYLLGRNDGGFGAERRFISPTPALMQREGMANCSARIEPASESPGLQVRAKEQLRKAICASDTVTGLVRRFRHSFNCGTRRPTSRPDLPAGRAGLIEIVTEQIPNPDSRVLLSDKTDRFGLRQTVLDWRLTEADKRNIRICATEVGKYFAVQDLGRVRVFDWVLQEDTSFPSRDDGEEVAGFHHMGTTRMGFSAADGVVDRDCRMFGVDNLYVAGSSVFRTSGYANPTLTIVQLALRLGTHLSGRAART